MVGLFVVVMEAVLGFVAAFGGAACIFARCVGTAAGNWWHSIICLQKIFITYLLLYICFRVIYKMPHVASLVT